MSTTSLLICSCFIAGIPHRSPDLTVVNEGDPLKLVPEPDNQYDPQAIKVYHGDQHLGYIPREATASIHEALANKLSLEATVVEKPMTKWKEIILHVRATIPGSDA